MSDQATSEQTLSFLQTLTAMFDAVLQNQLVWQQPIWLWGLLLPFIFIILSRLKQGQQKQSYADAHLWPWVKVEAQATLKTAKRGLSGVLINYVSRLMKVFSALRLLTLAWVLLVVAMAGPSSLNMTSKIDSRQGVDVMFDIDLSKSMLAEDMGVSRFTYAKNLIESLVYELKAQDRVALNVFAGQSHAVTPLTYDKSVLIQSLNTVSPGLLPIEGSWLQRSLIESLHRLQQTSQGAKVLVVLTDGAPPFWKKPELPQPILNLSSSSSQHFKDTGVKVIYVGVGLNRGASIPDSNDKTGKLHANGLLVQSRLEEQQLRRLAQQTGGIYWQADASQAFMEKLIQAIVAQAGEQLIKTPQQQWQVYSMPFIWLAMLFLFMAFYGRTLLFTMVRGLIYVWQSLMSSMKGSSGSQVKSVLSASLLVGLMLSASWSSNTDASEVPIEPLTEQQQANLQQGYAAFSAQDYEAAEGIYDGVSSFSGLFGAGSAAYRLDDLEAAVLYFRAAAWQAKHPQQRAQALFNLGNSYALANLLPQAVEAYQQALNYQTSYDKAEHNLALVKHRLAKEKKAKEEELSGEGKGEGKGGQGKDAEGAFYGGQKPNADPDPGKGADGDSDEGSRQGNQVNLPPAEQVTDYRINPSIAQLRLNSATDEKDVNPVIRAQRQQQRAEKFEHELQKLKDDQQQLLKRLFEREAGFEAAQEKSHPIPGVQPW